MLKEFTQSEKAEYQAIQHDMENTVVTLECLRIKKRQLLNRVAERTGNPDIASIATYGFGGMVKQKEGG